MIGENAQATGRHFNGWIDEVALYARALTPGQVANHFVAGGGSAIAASTRIQVPNLTAIDLSGTLDPAGGIVLAASSLPLTLQGFSLGGATAFFAKLPAGNASLNLDGSLVTTPITLDVAGYVQSTGGYELTTRAGGSFTLGGRPFAFSAPASFNSGVVTISGNVDYNPFTIGGTVKLETAGKVSFTGSATGDTGMRPFGKQVNGQPGHPYAGFVWTVSGNVNSTTPTFAANVSGTLSIEVEKFGGGYETKSFSMSSRSIGTDGKVSLIPGGVFQGISTFNFTLP
jgi:hypothetical protein